MTQRGTTANSRDRRDGGGEPEAPTGAPPEPPTRRKPEGADPPADTRRPAGRLPRGRHGLSRQEVIASQRRRMLDAMAELCAERSYPAVRIAEIISLAGVSRATFYELFKDKEDCFVATMEVGRKRLLNAVMPAAFDERGEWAERVAGVLEALLAYIAADPTYSRMAMVEAVAGGERAFERYSVGTQTHMALLDQGRAHAPPELQIPSTAARAAQGAAEAMIIEQMLAGRIDRVTELLPDLLYIVLTPYLGQAEALRQMEIARRRRARDRRRERQTSAAR